MSQRHASPSQPSIKRAASMFVLGATLLVTAAASQAAVITSLPDGTSHAFSAMNQFTSSAAHENGMTFTSTTGSSVYGYNGSYGLASNGQWNGNSPYIGLNSGSVGQYMTLTFDDPVASVLSFLNYAPGSSAAYIAVYDVTNHLIESLALHITTPGGVNAGASFGFTESSNVIKSIRFGNDFIVARDITTAAAAVPVPGTLPLMGLGIAGLVAFSRRKKMGAGGALSMASAA